MQAIPATSTVVARSGSRSLISRDPATKRGAAVRLASTGGRIASMVLACGLLGGCIGYDGDIQHGYQFDQQAVADVKTGQTA